MDTFDNVFILKHVHTGKDSLYVRNRESRSLMSIVRLKITPSYLEKWCLDRKWCDESTKNEVIFRFWHIYIGKKGIKNEKSTEWQIALFCPLRTVFSIFAKPSFSHPLCWKNKFSQVHFSSFRLLMGVKLSFWYQNYFTVMWMPKRTLFLKTTGS